MVEDCKWDVQVNITKPSVRYAGIDKFTNSEYERLLSCDLINLKSCPVETQRYFALTDWAKKLPWLVWSGNSLKTYFDGIISQAYAYKEKIGFVKTTLKTINNNIFIKNDQTQFSFPINSKDFKHKFLNGTNFKIDLGWTMKWSLPYFYEQEYKHVINLVNFTMYYSNSSITEISEYGDPSIIGELSPGRSIDSRSSPVYSKWVDGDNFTGYILFKQRTYR